MNPVTIGTINDAIVDVVLMIPNKVPEKLGAMSVVLTSVLVVIAPLKKRPTHNIVTIAFQLQPEKVTPSNIMAGNHMATVLKILRVLRMDRYPCPSSQSPKVLKRIAPTYRERKGSAESKPFALMEKPRIFFMYVGSCVKNNPMPQLLPKSPTMSAHIGLLVKMAFHGTRCD